MSLSEQREIGSRSTVTIKQSSLLPKPTYLMCSPDHFGIAYEINPWMHREVQPDLDLAYEQWRRLVAHLKLAGATIETIQSVASSPDMVFTADVGLINRHQFVMSCFRYHQRQAEAEYGAEWFRNRNYEVIELSGHDVLFESSDVLPFRDCILAGYGFRSNLVAHAALSHILKASVFSIKLVDPRLYHLDTCFCPLDDRHALIAPAAWDHHSCEVVKDLVPEPLVLELDEALTFCANSIVIGKTIVMPHCPLRVGRILERWGFTVCVSPVSEFLKAGGAVHCLTLAL